jgi:hypothetical protein
MPNKSSFHKWLNENKDFSNRYARACEERGTYYFEKMVEVAEDDSRDQQWGINSKTGERMLIRNPTAVQRDKLKVDTYKWIASKLNPKKFSDRLKIDGSTDVSGKVEVALIDYKEAVNAEPDDTV